MISNRSPLAKRRAGILLHPSSLPGAHGFGDLGADAFRFVDFLAASGITVWQMLPLTPTHGDLSPYQGLSVHAGNPLLINLEKLCEAGWLDKIDIGEEDALAQRLQHLRQAHQGFCKHANDGQRQALNAFVAEHAHWLNDYALFQSLRQAHGQGHWLDWPPELRDRQPEALTKARATMAESVQYFQFEQFVFFSQWQALRTYAREHGVLMFGDMPIFVAHDSAEVWAHREYFALDDEGKAEIVAGVPPDYFSETGQRWGNPHYLWQRMAEDDYAWWHQRMETQLKLFDWIRIDHFRGFEAYWEIPASEPTAMNGHWVTGPGEALFNSLQKQFPDLPLIAEDLGIITAEVDALRKQFGMPGMKILQFAFGGGADNPYLSHNHTEDSIVYTGTHDNDTTLGWYQSLPPEVQADVSAYLGQPDEEMPWSLIRAAYRSVAQVAIVPMQDVLALGSDDRMNIPGTAEGNWTWRFDWAQVDKGLPARLKDLAQSYGR